MTLELDGFEVVTAGHGTEAFTQYRAYGGDFQAIVTNGLEFVQWVRLAGYGGRIIIISGNLKLSEDDYQRYAISGICHKPFERGALVSLLIPA